MSEQKTTEKDTSLASALGVDLNKAAAFLEKVALDSFVERLGEHGLTVNSQEDLDQAIKIAQMVDQAAGEYLESQPSLFKQAMDKLSSSLGKGNTEADNHEVAAGQARLAKSAHMAADETVAAHILSLIDAVRNSNEEGQE